MITSEIIEKVSSFIFEMETNNSLENKTYIVK
jgi:hypothetical protein